jgi:hypothetical protein
MPEVFTVGSAASATAGVTTAAAAPVSAAAAVPPVKRNGTAASDSRIATRSVRNRLLNLCNLLDL